MFTKLDYFVILVLNISYQKVEDSTSDEDSINDEDSTSDEDVKPRRNTRSKMLDVRLSIANN